MSSCCSAVRARFGVVAGRVVCTHHAGSKKKNGRPQKCRRRTVRWLPANTTSKHGTSMHATACRILCLPPYLYVVRCVVFECAKTVSAGRFHWSGGHSLPPTIINVIHTPYPLRHPTYPRTRPRRVEAAAILDRSSTYRRHDKQHTHHCNNKRDGQR